MSKALETTELHDLSSVVKPDFVKNPEGYFSERAPPVQLRPKPPDVEECK